MWKRIAGYDNYEIHKDGRIKNIITGRILKHSLGSNGYTQIVLCKNAKIRTFRLHRLLADNFIPNPENKPCVNHIDGVKTNYSLSNLEWVTFSENNYHAVRTLKIKTPGSMLGKFGKDHNISKSFSIEYPNGKIIKYGSGLEFTRKTGFDHTSISWARINKKDSHLFVRGKMKGLIVHFELIL